MKDEIRGGKCNETGLFHGLFYINHPTPSGWDRLILKYSTTDGYNTPKEAVEKMKLAFTEEQLSKMYIEEFEEGQVF